MKQGVLPFQYEEEKKPAGMTALGYCQPMLNRRMLQGCPRRGSGMWGFGRAAKGGPRLR